MEKMLVKKIAQRVMLQVKRKQQNVALKMVAKIKDAKI